MLHLNFAPSSELLVSKLNANMHEVWQDPFAPPAVIVPSPAFGKWLQMSLARGAAHQNISNEEPFGCIANLNLLLLEKFLWKALTPDPSMRLLDVFHFQQIICGLLSKNLLQQPYYDPLRRYLDDGSGEVDSLKRIMVSARIAHQFLEYEYNRPSVWDESACTWKSDGIDACWLKNKEYVKEDTLNEAWQKDLYCKAIAALKNSSCIEDGISVRYISLPHLYRYAREKNAKGKSVFASVPPVIVLFGVFKISHFHRNVLVEISQFAGVSVHVYLTNPCAEFWEDVDTWRTRTYRRKWKHNSPKKQIGVEPRKPDDYSKSELEEFAQIPKDPRLLELWGRSGKENIFLWCPHAEWNFEYFCPRWVEEDHSPGTLLKALQLSLLRRQSALIPPQNASHWGNDGSLQIIASPDPTREIEELRECIFDLLKKDSLEASNLPLKISDIVVYIANMGEYIPHIHRVFGSQTPHDKGYIPYTIAGAPGQDSLFSQGMQVLLEMVVGAFDRANFFTLLRNPLVLATRKISVEDVSVWEQWAQELGIFRGFNKEHRKRMGDTGATLVDMHTFELGIARLLLGNLTVEPVKLQLEVTCENAEDGSFIAPYSDYSTSHAELVSAFCEVVVSLYTDVCDMAIALETQTITTAISKLTDVVNAWFFCVPEENGENYFVESRMRDDFLASLPAVAMQENKNIRNDRMSLNEFVSIVKSSLSIELPQGSSVWNKGLSFVPLKPSFIFPHRVVFVVGLNAALFPGSGDTTTWNLLSRRRIVGDSDVVMDNRFLFLELLHAALDTFIISYRSKNVQKEEELQPSSVILELESYLKSQGLVASPKNGGNAPCLCRREISSIVYESISNTKTVLRTAGTWNVKDLRLAEIDTLTKGIKSRYRLGDAQKVLTGNSATHYTATLHNLKMFFSNPLEYHLSKTLGIKIKETPITTGATNEPLLSGALEMSGILREIIKTLLYHVFPTLPSTTPINIQSLVEKATQCASLYHDQYLVVGNSPEGQFAAIEKQFILKWAQGCAHAIKELESVFPHHRVAERVNSTLGRNMKTEALDIVLNNNCSCKVETLHDLVLLPRSGVGKVGLLSIKKQGEASENPDLWLSGALQYCFENSLPQSEHNFITLVQINREFVSDTVNVSFAKINVQNKKDISTWLSKQLSEMLIENCAYHLPFKVVFDVTRQSSKFPLPWEDRWAKITKESLEDKLFGAEALSYKSFNEVFASTEVRLPPLTDEQLQSVCKERYAPMLQGWIHE